MEIRQGVYKGCSKNTNAALLNKSCKGAKKSLERAKKKKKSSVSYSRIKK
jgi:hypothetical protein